MKYKYDFFISHASEDKENVALPLANKLKSMGHRVWIDSFQLKVGDSLNKKINDGLNESRYGVVILSDSFFKNHWTKEELNGLVAKENGHENVILPIWHDINKKDVAKYSPILADKLALETKDGIEKMAEELGSVLPHKKKRQIKLMTRF